MKLDMKLSLTRSQLRDAQALFAKTKDPATGRRCVALRAEVAELVAVLEATRKFPPLPRALVTK